jgi:hypothetical protein
MNLKLGAQIRRKKLKKVIGVALVALALLITGCAGHGSLTDSLDEYLSTEPTAYCGYRGAGSSMVTVYFTEEYPEVQAIAAFIDSFLQSTQSQDWEQLALDNVVDYFYSEQGANSWSAQMRWGYQKHQLKTELQSIEISEISFVLSATEPTIQELTTKRAMAQVAVTIRCLAASEGWLEQWNSELNQDIAFEFVFNLRKKADQDEEWWRIDSISSPLGF